MKIVGEMKVELENRERKKDAYRLTELEKESIGKTIEKY